MRLCVKVCMLCVCVNGCTFVFDACVSVNVHVSEEERPTVYVCV